uniref:Uncharacterized protein n=2 Tax=Planktothrix pseudagardhii TaxID=132604 RepID=A0A9W4CJ33_9CYAN|nr:hypothetical protein NO713_02076 [Planktothrix pseudagardhii]
MGANYHRLPVEIQNFYLMLSTYLQILSDSQVLPTLDDFAERINQEHQKCLDTPQTSLIHARNAGEWLLHVQAQLSPEHWQVWFNEHFTFSPQTAAMYMQIAKKMPGVNPGVFSSAIDSNPNPSKTLVFPVKPILPDAQPQNSTNEVKTISPKSPQIAPQKPDFPVQNVETRLGEAMPKAIGASLPGFEMILTGESPTLKNSPIPEKPEVLESPVTRITINPKESIIDVEVTPINPPEPAPIEPQKPAKKTAELIKLMIPGVVVPKARPRVTSNGTYLPPRYRAWRNRAEVEIYRQISEQNITHKFPLRKAAIVIRLLGNHRTNSDIDNLAGACLDALTLNGAGVLIDDRLSCLPQLSVEFDPDSKQTGVYIEIEPL